MLTINLDDIISQSNVRVEVGDVTSLAASIEKVGMLQPPRVVVPDDGLDPTYVLVAGHRRVAAAKLLEWETIDVVLDDGSLIATAADVLAAQWAENTERKDLSAFEQIEVAWDLKLEGLKQADVAAIMGLDKSVVSKMHKTHKALTSDDLDATRATQLSAQALFELAEDVLPEHIPDVIRLIVDGEANTVWSAQRKVEQEYEAIEFMESIAEEQKSWHEMGVNVVTEIPTLTGETKEEYGSVRPQHDRKNRKELRDLGFSVEEHINEPCHVIYIKADGGYSSVTHWCVQTDRHRAVTKAKGEPLGEVSPKMKADAERKVEDSAERKERRDSKKLRFQQAAQWMGQRTKAADRELWALDRALDGWKSEHTKAALIMLDLLGTRPKGAEYSWYDTTFDTWMVDTFKGDSLAASRWQVRFLIAFGFIEQRYGHDGQFDDDLADIEIKEDG